MADDPPSVLSADDKLKRRKEKARACDRARYAKRREKLIAGAKLWREQNPERAAENRRRWKDENKETTKRANKEWVARNRSQVKAYHARLYEEQGEAIRERNRQWFVDNPEKAKKIRDEWKRANPDRVKAHSNARRAQKRKVGGRGITHEDIAALTARQKGRCALCGDKTKLTLDHIVPLIRGGAHDPANAQMLCLPCNLKKARYDPVDYSRRIGLLL